MKVSVLGCGRWGSFICWYLNSIGMNVTLWGRENSENLEKLKMLRKNDYLELDENIDISSDLSYCITNCDAVVISIASQSLRDFTKKLKSLNIDENIPIILCMKGIENSTGKRLSQVVGEVLKNPVAIWVGPGHVQDFIKGIPNCMVIDSENKELKVNLVNAFSSGLIRFYIGKDLIGNEIGAAAKNVIGIAAGMLDGMNFTSLKGALMSRGTREIARLIDKMGGQALSVYGLCHLGDYQATLFSEFSQNREFGERFVKKQGYTKLAEGFYTVKALVLLAKQYDVDLPICNAVNDILTKDLNPKDVLSGLFMRSLKNEF